jgi:hypothetical protein
MSSIQTIYHNLMAKLSKAAIQLREQIDDEYPSRDRRSDGSFADPRHYANSPTSDHIPVDGFCRAIDLDADFQAHKEEAHSVANRIRLCAKRGDKRIKYVIFDGRIASPILNWRYRKYRGANPHRSHIHISFNPSGDNDGSWFDLEGKTNAELN